MRNIRMSVIALLFQAFVLSSCNRAKEEQVSTPTTVILFNEVLYYDGYAQTVDEPVPENIVRVSNSKYATKITDEDLDLISNTLIMEITVRAACDNYDRLGHVFLSLVKKGESYDKNKLAGKIEIARFITPFMDKNKQPDQVKYTFQVDNVARLLKDKIIYNEYDFWMELDIFGVPYAANKEIAGCAGRNDTFYGTLKLISTNEEYANTDQQLVPISYNQQFDNYAHTDVIGETIRKFSINLEDPVKGAKIYLITSNHGANAGGEEYNRRNHNIYFDGNLIDTYMPGGKSCEPYRQYNTQGNGIYGLQPRTAEEWASFSNWCPGDKIPIRIYDLGDLNQGTHTFRIEVPDAEFVDKQGNIPLSVYLQGEK